MPWLELHIDTRGRYAEELETALMGCGALSTTLSDGADTPILEPGVGETPLWNRLHITALFDENVDCEAIGAQLAKMKGRAITAMSWRALDDQPWERAWMEHFQPLRCGERLWICPSWAEPPEPEAVNLILDPGLAFGSGTHPTTYLCLQWLDDLDLKNKTLVDYGCGSGILAIAALLLGAERAVAVDNDPQALLATRENLHRNRLDDGRLVTCLPEDVADMQADILVANILAGPLVALADRLTALVKPGGLLCLSGITVGQADQVAAAYEMFAFKPMAILEDWVRLQAVKVV